MAFKVNAMLLCAVALALAVAVRCAEEQPKAAAETATEAAAPAQSGGSETAKVINKKVNEIREGATNRVKKPFANEALNEELGKLTNKLHDGAMNAVSGLNQAGREALSNIQQSELAGAVHKDLSNVGQKAMGQAERLGNSFTDYVKGPLGKATTWFESFLPGHGKPAAEAPKASN